MSETTTDRMRGTGGNRFLRPDANNFDLLMCIRDGLAELSHYAKETGRYLDLGEVTISTRRIGDGRISVTVGADLANEPYGTPTEEQA